MLAISLEGNSWAHKMRVGNKLACLAIASISLFFVNTIWVFIPVLMAISALYLSVGTHALEKAVMLSKPLIWLVIILITLHALRGDFIQGLVVSARFISLVVLANFVTMTSRLTDMSSFFLWLLSPLKKVGLPSATIALAFAMVMRFTPQILNNAKTLAQAWRARSSKRVGWPIFMPLFVTAIDDADRVAEALRARGGIMKED